MPSPSPRPSPHAPAPTPSGPDPLLAATMHDLRHAYDTHRYINLTKDLRLGTFGHPWESGPQGRGTLCVFGTELLAEVEEDLNRLLGAPMRRDGQRIG